MPPYRGNAGICRLAANNKAFISAIILLTLSAIVKQTCRRIDFYAA